MMLPIQGLHQFSTYIPPMDFTIHCYLLAMDPAVMFASGTVRQASAAIPEVRRILGDRRLGYVFVSHMESDECGGLGLFLEEFPGVKVICSSLCARELPGFGIDAETVVMAGGDVLRDGELSIRAVDYPSEVHLQEGLVCIEENSGVMYSADLFLRRGDGRGKVLDARWKDEVESIGPDRVPDDERLVRVKRDLLDLSPEFVAVGHGFCIRCVRSGNGADAHPSELLKVANGRGFEPPACSLGGCCHIQTRPPVR